MRNPPKEELEGRSSVGGFDFISTLRKLFLVLIEEWRWKPARKFPLLQITEPLIQAVPRAQSRGMRYKGINSSSFWEDENMGRSSSWQGAAPASLTFGLVLCPDPTRFSSFLLLLQRVFLEVFSGFVVFCLFCFAVFLHWGCFVNERLHFPEFRTPSLLWEQPQVVESCLPAEPHKSLTVLLICFFHGVLNLPVCSQFCLTFRESPSGFPGAF